MPKAPCMMTLFSLKGNILLQSDLSGQYFGTDLPKRTFTPGGLQDAPTCWLEAGSALSELFKLAPSEQVHEMMSNLRAHGAWSGESLRPGGGTTEGAHGDPCSRLLAGARG